MPLENHAMSADSLSIPAESLLEHREFVRRLARSLVHDEHAAADLVQDTWVEALRRPPTSTSGMRAWLASVVRTRARNKARGEERRTSRELAAAREETDRTEEILRERFALQHKVVEAVLALKEPYKTVVLLHYYEGLTPSAIAARRGAPSGTVRAQLARAHELLRERLDAEFGGARAAWSTGLLGLTRAGGAVLAAKLALLGALCVALGVPTILWVGRSSTKAAPPLVAAAARPLEASPPVEPDPSSTPTAVASARAALPASAQRVPSRPSAPAQARAEIHGRFVLPDGKPANGVSVEVQGTPGNEERVAEFGAPKDWSVPPATTGADGKFSVTLDPPRAFQFIVRAKLGGFCTETWRWNEIEPGASKDLGDVTLRRGGSVAGRVVDAKGRPVPQDWTVRADGVDPHSPSDRERVRAWGPVDRATGEFRLDGLAPGPNNLTASSRAAHGIQGPRVEIRAGEVAHAEIVYDGPDLGSRITVELFAEPSFLVLESPPEIVLQGPGAETRKAKRIPRSQNFAFEGVPPGDYTLAIDDPRFRPWTATGIAPGQTVRADLQGSASLRLTVVDAKTGAAVPRYTATLRFDRTRMRPNTVTLVPHNTDPPENGRFDGLLATSQTLIVGAPGYADLVLPLGDLQRDEARAVKVSLSSGARLSGRVVQGPEKKVLSGVQVYLVPAAPRDRPPRMSLVRTDPAVKSTRSDESGRFAFTTLPAGSFDVVAECRPGIFAKAVGVALGASETKDDVELAYPAFGGLKGRVLGPEGASFEGLSLYARPANESTAQGVRDRPMYFWTPPQDLRTPISADGSYDMDALEAGTTRVTLEFPMVTRPTTGDGFASDLGAWVELGTFDVPHDAVTQRDFDLRSAFPGTARFTATLAGGMAAIGAVVEVQNNNESRPFAAAAVLDDHGQARIGPLPPGSYKLLLRDVDTEWFYFVPNALEIPAAGESSSSVDVPLVSGELSVVDADSGEPLASPQLRIRLDGIPRSPVVGVRRSPWVVIRTDAAGRAKVRLPPGRYWLLHELDVHNPTEEDPKAVAFDWTDQGPSPAVLRLAKPAEAK
jgi:RNA polymerase sigma-70 factor (ECF subfamily)